MNRICFSLLWLALFTACSDDSPDPKCTGNSTKENGDCVCQQAWTGDSCKTPRQPTELTITYLSRPELAAQAQGDYTLTIKSQGETVYRDRVTLSGSRNGFKLPLNVTLPNPDVTTDITLTRPGKTIFGGSAFTAVFRPYQAMKAQNTVTELQSNNDFLPTIQVGIAPQF